MIGYLHLTNFRYRPIASVVLPVFPCYHRLTFQAFSSCSTCVWLNIDPKAPDYSRENHGLATLPIPLPGQIRPLSPPRAPTRTPRSDLRIHSPVRLPIQSTSNLPTRPLPTRHPHASRATPFTPPQPTNPAGDPPPLLQHPTLHPTLRRNQSRRRPPLAPVQRRAPPETPAPRDLDPIYDAGEPVHVVQWRGGDSLTSAPQRGKQ